MPAPVFWLAAQAEMDRSMKPQRDVSMNITEAHIAMIRATERLLALLADAVRELNDRVSALESKGAHTMSDSPTPDEEAPPPAPDEAPPADPAPEAVEVVSLESKEPYYAAADAIETGTLAEPFTGDDGVQITHDVAPNAPR